MKRGFTLVELLVVMSIIGVLVTIGLVAFRSSQVRGRDAQRKSDLRQIANSLELFYSDHEKYPIGTGMINACEYNPSTGQGTACSWGSGEFSDGRTTYFKVLPKDPVVGGNYYYVSTGPNFKLYARLENTQDPSYPNDYGVSCGLRSCNFAITSANTTP